MCSLETFIPFILFVKHDDTAGSYQQGTHNDFCVYRFFQEHERQADGDNHTKFVDGGNTGYIAQLQGSEIKNPASITTMLGLSIFVDVRLRETIVIIGDCSTVSLITIFLCLGYIHFCRMSLEKAEGQD